MRGREGNNKEKKKELRMKLEKSRERQGNFGRKRTE